MGGVVIIGASLAGHTVAINLRQRYGDYPITLVTEEDYPFYDRRRLADFLRGAIEEKELFLSSEGFYKDMGIVFLKKRRVTFVNTEKKHIYFKDNSILEYDFLVICSGERINPPQIPGVKKEGVFSLYSLSDFKGFLRHLDLATEPVCIVGQDSFTINIASSIALKGKEVKLIARDASPLTEIIGEAQVQAVRLKSGKVISVSLIGFMQERKASTEFLRDTPVEICQNKICVSEVLRTNVENIFAAGKVCSRREEVEKSKTWEEIIEESKKVNIFP